MKIHFDPPLLWKTSIWQPKVLQTMMICVAVNVPGCFLRSFSSLLPLQWFLCHAQSGGGEESNVAKSTHRHVLFSEFTVKWQKIWHEVLFPTNNQQSPVWVCIWGMIPSFTPIVFPSRPLFLRRKRPGASSQWCTTLRAVASPAPGRPHQLLGLCYLCSPP